MLRRSCVTVIAAVVAAGMAISAAAAGGRAAPLSIVTGPYQMNVTQHSITIMWETNRPASSVVEYGVELPAKLRAEGEGESQIHEVTITDLPAETIFFYRVASEAGGEVARSEVHSFMTAVKEGTPFAFAAVGDNRTYPENWRRIADLCYGERPNFVINVGDVCTDGNVYEQWREEWLEPASELMAQVPMYVSIGNHENNAQWFYYYVSYPEPENYYSFDYGDAHFACVDTNQDVSPGSAQYEWLEDDLGSSKARWKFVSHHHPVCSSEGDNLGAPLAALYERYGVDMVLVGHIHTYERTWPVRQEEVDPDGGVIYLQVGGGGAELMEVASQRLNFTAKVARCHHYVTVGIAGDRLRMMAYDIEGRMFDYLDIEKK